MHHHPGSGFDRDAFRSEARAPVGLSERKDRCRLLVKRDRLLARSRILGHAFQLKQPTTTDRRDRQAFWHLPPLEASMRSDGPLE